jgi:hypothetical protein
VRARRIGVTVAFGLVLVLAGCDATPTTPYVAPCQGEQYCQTPLVVQQAATKFGGPHGQMFTRRILVTVHGSADHMTWMPLYVSVRPDGKAELIDYVGQTYLGGLDDFRAHNTLLSSADVIEAPKDITSSSPHVTDLVQVSGHTDSSWIGWLIGGIVVLVLILVALIAMRIRGRRGDPIDWGDPNDPGPGVPGAQA